MTSRHGPPSIDEQAELREREQTGAIARQLADFARNSVVERQAAAITARVFAILDSDEPLNSDLAVQSWIQMHAAYRFVKKLERIAKDGISATDTLRRVPSENQ